MISASSLPVVEETSAGGIFSPFWRAG
jgi:hypothetical protein